MTIEQMIVELVQAVAWPAAVAYVAFVAKQVLNNEEDKPTLPRALRQQTPPREETK